MKLATPRGWYERHRRGASVTRVVLAPISWVWSAVTAARIARAAPVDPGVPVICVGNLTLGGSGKTPVARALAERLAAAGAHILVGGYGGRLRGPLRVDPGRHTAADVGDEALLLAATAPVWLARDRVAGARAAAAGGAGIVLMDDGHQNPSLRKSLSLIVVDGETRDGEWPFGDGAVFPAGPMREPLRTGLARADAVVVLLPDDLPTADGELIGLFAGKRILLARLSPVSPPPTGRMVGFAGIAKPWRMERALAAAGCDLVDFAPLPDHAALDESTLRFLSRRSASLGAGLITSEKDWVRLPPRWRAAIAYWPMAVRFEDEAALDDLLGPVVG
jgi:tetraacyldisaccharide 4'-kinase